MARPTFYTPVRRNHAIAPFGVGSIFRARNGVTVVMCGLADWMDKRPGGHETWLDQGRIVDGYLQSTLRVARLIEPPMLADEPTPNNTWFLPVARFPTFEHCVNPKCRQVVRRTPDEVASGRCTHCSASGGKNAHWPTLQIPLVLACEDGHLSDVPWDQLAHDSRLHDGYVEDENQPIFTPVSCAHPRLTYKIGASVAYPQVTCEACGSQIRIGPGVRLPIPCPGERAWLPGSEAQPCLKRPALLERTATNLYYPDVRSALYIPSGPELNHRLIRFLEHPVALALLDERRATNTALDERDLKELARNARRFGIDCDLDDVARHLDHAESQAIDPELERTRELDALLSGVTQTSTGAGFAPLIVETLAIENFHSSRFQGPDKLISHVSAVTRLAETKVLAGFSRIAPAKIRPQEGFEMLWGAPPNASQDRDWLPAHRVYGEGILILLDPARVSAWEDETLKSRAHYRDGTTIAGRELGPRDLLADTLAHLFIREVASSCGYALPSLRERIYVDSNSDGQPRTGFLVYTADGDSYGTLGGLVELAQAGKLEVVLERVLANAHWCGADPICIDPPSGAGLQISPGSCHHCLLLPETSCEYFNQWLDRASLIGRRATPRFF